MGQAGVEVCEKPLAEGVAQEQREAVAEKLRTKGANLFGEYEELFQTKDGTYGTARRVAKLILPTALYKTWEAFISFQIDSRPPCATLKEVARKLNKQQRTVEMNVRRLRELHYLETEMVRHEVHWVVEKRFSKFYEMIAEYLRWESSPEYIAPLRENFDVDTIDQQICQYLLRFHNYRRLILNKRPGPKPKRVLTEQKECVQGEFVEIDEMVGTVAREEGASTEVVIQCASPEVQALEQSEQAGEKMLPQVQQQREVGVMYDERSGLQPEGQRHREHSVYNEQGVYSKQSAYTSNNEPPRAAEREQPRREQRPYPDQQGREHPPYPAPERQRGEYETSPRHERQPQQRNYQQKPQGSRPQQEQYAQDSYQQERYERESVSEQESQSWSEVSKGVYMPAPRQQQGETYLERVQRERAEKGLPTRRPSGAPEQQQSRTPHPQMQAPYEDPREQQRRQQEIYEQERYRAEREQYAHGQQQEIYYYQDGTPCHQDGTPYYQDYNSQVASNQPAQQGQYRDPQPSYSQQPQLYYEEGDQYEEYVEEEGRARQAEFERFVKDVEVNLTEEELYRVHQILIERFSQPAQPMPPPSRPTNQPQPQQRAAYQPQQQRPAQPNYPAEQREAQYHQQDPRTVQHYQQEHQRSQRYDQGPQRQPHSQSAQIEPRYQQEQQQYYQEPAPQQHYQQEQLRQQKPQHAQQRPAPQQQEPRAIQQPTPERQTPQRPPQNQPASRNAQPQQGYREAYPSGREPRHRAQPQKAQQRQTEELPQQRSTTESEQTYYNQKQVHYPPAEPQTPQQQDYYEEQGEQESYVEETVQEQPQAEQQSPPPTMEEWYSQKMRINEIKLKKLLEEEQLLARQKREQQQAQSSVAAQPAEPEPEASIVYPEEEYEEYPATSHYQDEGREQEEYEAEESEYYENESPEPYESEYVVQQELTEKQSASPQPQAKQKLQPHEHIKAVLQRTEGQVVSARQPSVGQVKIEKITEPLPVPNPVPQRFPSEQRTEEPRRTKRAQAQRNTEPIPLERQEQQTEPVDIRIQEETQVTDELQVSEDIVQQEALFPETNSKQETEQEPESITRAIQAGENGIYTVGDDGQVKGFLFDVTSPEAWIEAWKKNPEMVEQMQRAFVAARAATKGAEDAEQAEQGERLHWSEIGEAVIREGMKHVGGTEVSAHDSIPGLRNGRIDKHKLARLVISEAIERSQRAKEQALKEERYENRRRRLAREDEEARSGGKQQLQPATQSPPTEPLPEGVRDLGGGYIAVTVSAHEEVKVMKPDISNEDFFKAFSQKRQAPRASKIRDPRYVEDDGRPRNVGSVSQRFKQRYLEEQQRRLDEYKAACQEEERLELERREREQNEQVYYQQREQVYYDPQRDPNSAFYDRERPVWHANGKAREVHVSSEMAEMQRNLEERRAQMLAERAKAREVPQEQPVEADYCEYEEEAPPESAEPPEDIQY